jgi:hypothetical protein
MLLFNTYDLRLTLNEIFENIRKEVQEKNNDYILNVNQEKYVQFLYQKYEVNCIALKFEDVYATTIEKIIPSELIPRTFTLFEGESYIKPVIKYHIPFIGDEKWLKSRATSFLMWRPDVEIYNNEIILEYIIFGENYVETIKREYEHDISNFKKQIQYINDDINKFKESFFDSVNTIFQSRKNELLKTNELLQTFNVPIRKNTNVSETFTIPSMERRKQIICEPILDNKTIVRNKPEGRLDDITYTQILKIIDDMGKEFERLPSLYKNKDEETLRDHMLMLLQPNFQGSATGETFNKSGKTDILLRYENNNVFVGECKFWHGEVGYLKTVTQLLSYLTWRDSKVAIIIFVKQKNITDIIKKIEEYTPKHENYLSKEYNTSESIFNYLFHLNGDKDRKVKVAVMLYHLPT